jgi:DNA repair exonuclease SbcCD ATPase subunit
MTELSAEMLAAILTDDAKAKRLTELLEQEKANKAILEQAQQAQAAAAADLAEMRKAVMQASQLTEDAETRHRRLDEEERALEGVVTSLNAEKDAFTKIRAQVEADLAERKAAIEAAESSLKTRLEAVEAREAAVQRSGAISADLRRKLEIKHSRLHAALAENEAEDQEAEGQEEVKELDEA